MKFTKIRQLFERNALSSVEETLVSAIEGVRFQNAVSGRKHIAIAVGSRGISNIVTIVKTLVGYLKNAGAEPFIVPAMGSHGSANVQGQIEVLAKLGITKQSVGAEICSSMDVIAIGQVQMNSRSFDVYVDRTAWESDGVILINRVKQHSDFTARYESGLLKMATVGLGNHEGAMQVHSLGTVGLRELMPALGQVVLGSDRIIGGFALIEDAYHETAAINWLNNDRIMKEEPELLEQAMGLMPYFPVDDIDLLIIKWMGKDISGVGLDPKVIGRMMIKTEDEPEAPTIEMIGICDITDASCGNALGVGLGDFITQQLFDKIDFQALKENILTSTFYQRGKIPIVLQSEREILENAQKYFQRRGNDHIKAIIIKDTLHLSEVYVTEPVLNAIAEPENIEIIDPAREIEYDSKGRILTLL